MNPKTPMRLLFTLVALPVLSLAQVYQPPPAQPAQPAAAAQSPAQQPAQPGTNPSAAQPSQQPSAAAMLGQEIPFLDPAAETLTVGGVTIPLGDNRLLKARFEKFLNQPPDDSEAAYDYRQTLAGILDSVSPFRDGGPDINTGFKMLPRAASYTGDANICFTLAEAVYTSMLSKRDITGLRQLSQSLEKEKQQLIREGDWTMRPQGGETINRTATPASGGQSGQPRQPQQQPRQPGQAGQGGQGGQGGQQGGQGPGNGPTAQPPPPSAAQTLTLEPGITPGTGVSSLKFAEILRRITEIEITKQANLAKSEAQVLRTKAQFQVNMIQWFLQRRYEHVVMAARFYNQIWKDGDSELLVKEDSKMSKLFSESVGVSPTVSTLDSLGNEAIREATKYVEAFEQLLASGQLHSASQRLMEAFALGEYLEPLATMPLETKLKVSGYVNDLHRLYDTLQGRDYNQAREVVKVLKTSARDFPSSKFESAIAASTMASNFAIEEAKGYLLAGERDKAAEKIKVAAESWPTNPELDEFGNLLKQSGVLITARNDFDRLLNEKNFREIARRQYELAPAIAGDAVREDAFKQIVVNLTKIEAALGKAAEFSKMGQSYAAWEQLAMLREEFDDDPNLGRELEKLAPEVADLTRALNRAKQFEERADKQTGSALAWYLKARALHPRSTFAEAGIQRLLDDILPEKNQAPAPSPDQPPATPVPAPASTTVDASTQPASTSSASP